MPGTRTWLILGCVAVLGCRSAEVAGSRVDPVLAALIPGDSVMLAGARMEEIRATPVYKRLLIRQRLQELDKFAAETGFDPRKDVRELLMASNGKDTVVVARGKFPGTGIPSAKKLIYKGYTLFENEEGAYAVLDTTTAVAGKTLAVRSAIDQYKSGNRNAAAALLRKAQEVPGPNQIWAVSIGWGNFLERAAPETGNAANFGKIFRSLENTTFAADLRTGLNATATGLCTTEQDARTLHDALRGLVGLGRLSVPDNQPELARFYDGIKVEQQQRSLKITVSEPLDLLDKLLEMTGSLPLKKKL